MHTIFFYVFTVFILLSCSKSSNGFKSDFSSSTARTWIGPEYWSNPMQDWHVEKGELTNLTSNKNRNIHLLTHHLDTNSNDFSIRVKLKLLNTETKNKAKSWIGFSLGSKGQFNDYRDNAIFGKGLNVGVSTLGQLFINKIPDHSKNDEILKTLSSGVSLEIVGVRKSTNYQLKLRLYDQNNIKIAEISENNINANQLHGDLVLVSHFENERNDPNKFLKSVSFKDWEIKSDKLIARSNNHFGPILFSQYTMSRGKVKLTAQMAPVIISEEKVKLQIKEKNSWITISESDIDPDSRTASFSISDLEPKVDTDYRLSYAMDRGDKEKKAFYWEGTFRKEPFDKDDIVIAGFTGNDHLGFPNSDITNQVKYHNPDVLFFSGDQIYEPNGGYGAQRSPTDKAILDYLRKWAMYGWAYRDLMKDRPTVSITDDHDVYHGNIWGSGGRAIPKELGQGAKAQDFGGYKMPARWVRMVERTQTSHLPDPYDPTPVAQNIGTYYTDMVYAGISFAILEDRKFKSAPAPLLPEAQIKNGWSYNKKFNMKIEGDQPNAKMLGERQLKFLDHWSSDWSYRAEMKILLSQTIFANVATLPKEAMSGAIIPKLRIMHKDDYPPDDRPVSDMDSNGWPQTGRNNALKLIRKGFSFHLAGDQHLGSTIHYGVDDWNDSGYAFCVPSISNHWPRRWYPAEGGKNRQVNLPKYTGENQDGFGNKMTVYAASNPLFTGKEPSRLYDRATGYGIVRMNKKSREIIIECWPRLADPKKGDQEQYDGWPIKISQEDNYGRKGKAFLPEIRISGLEKAVVEIKDETMNEIVYSLRLNSNTYRAKVFEKSHHYQIRVGDPDKNIWQTKVHVTAGEGVIEFGF